MGRHIQSYKTWLTRRHSSQCRNIRSNKERSMPLRTRRGSWSRWLLVQIAWIGAAVIAVFFQRPWATVFPLHLRWQKMMALGAFCRPRPGGVFFRENQRAQNLAAFPVASRSLRGGFELSTPLLDILARGSPDARLRYARGADRKVFVIRFRFSGGHGWRENSV